MDFILPSFERSINGETLSITSTDKIIFESSKSDPPSYFLDFPITLKIDYYELGIESVFAMVGQGIRIASVITTGILLTVSYKKALTLVKLFQMLDFFIYLDVNKPANLVSYMKFFNMNMFTVFPNFLEIDESDLNCNLDPILIENEMQCLGLNNINDLIAWLLILLAIKIWVSGLARIFRKRPKEVKKIEDVSPTSENGKINEDSSNRNISTNTPPSKSFIGSVWELIKVVIIAVNNEMNLSFYWIVMISM